MKNIVILGSTGSLGRQALKVIKKYSKKFKVIALSANKNEKLLLNQAKKLKISPQNTILVSKKGKDSLKKLIRLKKADIIINVISGIAGIEPTLTAIKSGKTILLGNKESLVAAGKNILKLTNSSLLDAIIPLDSEHNAIYEILKKYPNQKIKKIILPCSGGPFLNMTKKELKDVTAKKALIHPVWAMGPKITIESATLINKGLEIIEAHYLFNLPLSKIEICIHPECQIHGMVEFYGERKEEEFSAKKSVRRFSRVAQGCEIFFAGTIRSPAQRDEDVPRKNFTPGDRTREKNCQTFLIAYIAPPDMREHIENALFRAINLPPPNRNIRPINKNEFTLNAPNHKAFPGIKIVLNAFKKNPLKMKNFLQKEEKIISKFLQNKIKFPEIFSLLSR